MTTETTAATTNKDAEEEGHPSRWWILVVLAAVAFMAQLDLFVVNIALPAIGASYRGTGLSSLSWVLNGYAIVFAALLVPAGRLADHFGRRRFLLTGVLVFTLASAACAAAPTLALLVVARVVQAIGAALVVPTSLGLLYPAFPRRQHATVVGIWAGVAAVAATAGPPVGGLLVGIDWRWIFVINLPIGLATLIGGVRILPEVRAERGSRLPDGISALLLLAAVTLVVLSTVQGPSWGWTAPGTLALFAGAAVSIVLTVLRTLRHPHALIERNLFESRPFTAATVAIFVFFIGFAVILLSVVLFLQDQWHYGAVRAGLAIAPGPAVSASFAINAGRITKRFGRTIPASVGAACMVIGAISWAVLIGPHPDYVAAFLPGMILSGISAGLIQAPLFAAAATLPAERATTGSAVLTTARQIGSAFGVAVVVVILGNGATHSTAQYHHVWLAEAATGVLTLVAVLAGASSPPRAGVTAEPVRNSPVPD